MFPIRDTQPSYSRPFVTVIIILINVAVFLYEITLDPYSQNNLIARAERRSHPEFARRSTSAFRAT